jgi:hypothetical protein
VLACSAQVSCRSARFSWSRNGRKLLISCADGHLSRWDVVEGKMETKSALFNAVKLGKAHISKAKRQDFAAQIHPRKT